MYLFFQSVAEAVVAKGLAGLADLVPGGRAIYDFAEDVWKRYRLRSQKSELQAEIREMAQASFEEAKQAAVAVARQAAPDQPEMQVLLEQYLPMIPASVRQSLKRPDDPTGRTVPPAFTLSSADDVAKLLPQALPRFRSGAALPGRAGWVLDRQLGVGGFGEVWLAKNPKTPALLRAVKFCRHLENRDRVMLHESKVMDRLRAEGSHANIVGLLDVSLEGDSPWLMYEYVEGGDLGDLIRRWAKLPGKERQEKATIALKQLCKAAGSFHRLEPAIVHRDLKPANILLDRKTKQLRITDFGIGGIAAREMIENETRGATTRAGRLQTSLYGSCTPLYASPQQREGAAPDPRDDVHALGVIGYQMLTGQLTQGAGPDFAADLQEAGIDKDLIDLLGRCTAQKADRRPRNAGEMADELFKIASPESPPLAAKPPPIQARRHRRFEVPDWKWIAGAGVVGLLALVFLLVFWSAQKRVQPSPQDPVELAPLPRIQEHEGWRILADLINESFDRIHPAPAVIAAWEKTGAEFGWIGFTKEGRLSYRSDQPPSDPLDAFFSPEIVVAGSLPAFLFRKSPAEKIAFLASPTCPFGLCFGFDCNVTDNELKQLAGLTELHSLILHSDQVTDAGVRELAGLKQLRSLKLDGSQITDAGLKEVTRLPHLQSLSLCETKVTGPGLRQLASLTQLRTLELSMKSSLFEVGDLRELRRVARLQSLFLGFTKMTDAGLKEIGELKQLEILSIYDAKEVTDKGVKELGKLTQLVSLELWGSHVTDSGLKELAKLKKLRSLSLGSSKVTDEGLESLAGLAQLEKLVLSDTQVTGKGLKRFAALHVLYLNDTKFTDTDLKELAGLKNLQVLYLNDTQVSDVGLKVLAGLKQLQTLGLAGTKVTDGGLKEIAGLKGLQWLGLAKTQVTDAGVRELERALPQARITR